MASTVVNADRIGTGVQVTLVNSQDLYITRDVLVARTDGQTFGELAVSAKFSSHQIDVYGDVVSTGNGIEAGSQTTTTANNHIYIAEDALVRSFSGSAIQMMSGASTLTNDGTLRASQSTVVMGSTTAGAASRFENNGTVLSDTTAVLRFTQSTDGLVLINNGLIKGTAFAYFANASDTFDTIINNGQMVGDINLGAGKDLYDGRNGTIKGIVFGGAGIDDLRGGAAFDQIEGGTESDSIDGGAGDDFLDGESGDDIIDGGSGNDTLIGGDGADTIAGGTGNDQIFAGSGNNIIDGGSGDDLINTGEDDDTILGGSGNDEISASIGADIIDSGSGNDSILGGEGDDIIRGGTGNDLIDGEGNLDTIFGDSGNDTINGGGSVDTIGGGSGDDIIDGGTSSDRIAGDTGADRLTGGTGADRFIYTTLSASTKGAAGRDTILDFTQADGDRIDLSTIDASSKASGNQAFTFIGTGAFTKTAGQLRFSVDDDRSFVLADVNGDGISDFIINLSGEITLQSADFIL